jgi:hypothetical protein
MNQLKKYNTKINHLLELSLVIGKIYFCQKSYNTGDALDCV